MRFRFDGQQYSFSFAYPKPTECVREIAAREIFLPARRIDGQGTMLGGGPGESILITLTETRRAVHCQLSKWDESTGAWKLIGVREAHASAKDLFNRKIGREIALDRFAHDNPFVQYKDVRKPGAHAHVWELVWGDVQRGAEFYGEMRKAWAGRFMQGGKGAAVKERADGGAA